MIHDWVRKGSMFDDLRQNKLGRVPARPGTNTYLKSFPTLQPSFPPTQSATSIFPSLAPSSEMFVYKRGMLQADL